MSLMKMAIIDALVAALATYPLVNLKWKEFDFHLEAKNNANALLA